MLYHTIDHHHQHRQQNQLHLHGQRSLSTTVPLSNINSLITTTSNLDMGQAQSGSGSCDNAAGGTLVSRIAARLAAADPAEARAIGGVFLFNIIEGQSILPWTMDLNAVRVFEGEPDDEPDATLTLTASTLRRLASGEDARQLFAAGKCSVTGDVMRAMMLEPYIKLE